MSTLLQDYLTGEELARELNRDVRTLERWAAQQIGPPITYLGKTPRYRRYTDIPANTILSWFKNHSESNAAHAATT